MTNKHKQNYGGVAEKTMLSLICLVLSGCGDDMNDLEQRLAEIKARPKTGIAPLTPPKITEPYSFATDGSRNPFEPVEKETAPGSGDELDNGIKPDRSRIKEELESYAAENVTMVGTITDLKNSTLWGLVRAANGTLYKVKVGNYVGLNDGKIIEISNKEIKFDEIVADKSSDDGKDHWKKHSDSLKMVATQ